MRKYTFPKFEAHEQASCFNCGGDFGPAHWSKSGHARGNGEFVQSCAKCGEHTWYDLTRHRPMTMPAASRERPLKP